MKKKQKCFYCPSTENIQEWQRGHKGDAHGNPIRVPMCDSCSKKYSGERWGRKR